MKVNSGRRLRRAKTISDVAQRAGVSPMTVSRVINGEKNVKETTREAVHAAIRELNYAPNPAARRLAGRDLMRIGLLYGNPSAAYLSEFLIGALDTSNRSSIQLLIEKCAEAGDEVAAARRLIAAGIEGVILPPPLSDSAEVRAVFVGAGVRVAAVASADPSLEVSSVRIDDYEAARLMTRHLISLGHQRIGFIRGHPRLTASARRQEGYVAALREAGLEPRPELQEQGYFTYRSGLEAAERLLAGRVRPTAIFASNDDMAAGAVAAAHRAGLEPPRDLAVCGFDDSPIATTIWPELTTIHQPIAEMARRAVDLVADEIRSARAGEAPGPTQVTLDFSLVRRGTDA